MSDKKDLFNILGNESKKNTIKKGSSEYSRSIETLQTILKEKKSVVTFINKKPVRISLDLDGKIQEEILSLN